MKEYKVSFTLFTFRQSEIIEAETIFKAEKIVKQKYGEQNVEIICSASTNNGW